MKWIIVVIIILLIPFTMAATRESIKDDLYSGKISVAEYLLKKHAVEEREINKINMTPEIHKKATNLWGFARVFLTQYISTNGDGPVLRLGLFYRDMLKIDGNRILIETCINETKHTNTNFSSCLDEQFLLDEDLQKKHEEKLKPINAGIKALRKVGMFNLPFIDDFLG